MRLRARADLLLAVGAAFNLDAARLFSRRGYSECQSYLREIHNAFRAHAAGNLKIRELSDLITSGSVECVPIPGGYAKPGSTPLIDLLALSVLTKWRRPRLVFEIGTFEGLSASVIALSAGDEARVITLDLNPDDRAVARSSGADTARSVGDQYETGGVVKKLGLESRVTIIQGDSKIFEFSPYFGKIDLFFIDGAHTRDYALSDSLAALRCISDDGVVVWHDSLNGQVNSVLQTLSRNLPIYYLRGSTVTFARGAPPAKVIERLTNTA